MEQRPENLGHRPSVRVLSAALAGILRTLWSGLWAGTCPRRGKGAPFPWSSAASIAGTRWLSLATGPRWMCAKGLRSGLPLNAAKARAAGLDLSKEHLRTASKGMGYGVNVCTRAFAS